MKEFMKIKSKTEELEIEKICLGLDRIELKEKGSELVERFLEEHRFLDVARVYGNEKQNGGGGSEEFVGKLLKSKGLTNKVILSTKGGHPKNADKKDDRLGKTALTDDLNQSLSFLKRDYVDIYFLHRDSGHDLFDLMQTLHGFVKSGKVRFLGASNFSAERIEQANKIAEQCGFEKFAISQIAYSLAKTTPELWEDDTLVAMNDQIHLQYEKNKIPLMAFTSQGKGFFGKFESGTFGDKCEKRYNTSENRETAEKVLTLSKKYHVSPSAIALRFLLDDTIEVAPIISASKVEQLDDSLTALQFKLSKEDFDFLKK